MKALLSHLGAWAPMAEQKAVAKYLVQKENISAYLEHFKSEVAFRLKSIHEGFILLKEIGFMLIPFHHKLPFISP